MRVRTEGGRHDDGDGACGLGDRRFLTSVITAVLGGYALASVIKNNQARPVRRAIHWYNVRGEVHDMKVLHDARRAVKQDKG